MRSNQGYQPYYMRSNQDYLPHYMRSNQGYLRSNKGHHPQHYMRSNMGYPLNNPNKNMGQHMQKGPRQPSGQEVLCDKEEQNCSYAELNALSTKEMQDLEVQVGHLKLSDFSLLREKYETRSLTLTSLKHQLSSYTERYKKEILKDKEKQDPEILKQYRLLEKEVKTLSEQLDEIESKIKKMVDTPSPFAVHNIKMPRLGAQDSYDHKKLECIPYSDEKTSVREVWNFLCEVGEDLNLSEKGFKRALWSRLTSEQREAFDSYREQALKEAISSLVCHFDNPLKSYHYHDLITNFSRKPKENITNSIYRLLSYVEKAFRNTNKKENEDEDLKVLRIRTLEDKLRGMCRSKEMFAAIMKKLDKIREQNKTPTVTDIIQAAQLEEEIFERSEMDKMTLSLNNIDIEDGDENEVFAIEEQQEHEQDNQYEPNNETEYEEQYYNPRWDKGYNMGNQDFQNMGQSQQMNRGYNMGNNQYNPNSGMGHQGRNQYHQRQYYERRNQWNGHQNQRNYGRNGQYWQQRQFDQHGQFGYNNEQRYKYQNKFNNRRRADLQDQPWIPPVVTQRVTLTEEEANVVETSSKNGNDKEETESIIY